jgi:hypothetical protein
MALPEDAGPEHRYFAAVSDYVTVKVAAAKYAAQPSTPVEQAVAIVAVVEDGDAYIGAVDAVRRGDCADPSVAKILPELSDACVLADADYLTATGALRVTSSILRKLALEEESN